jgi:hypothetical protein
MLKINVKNVPVSSIISNKTGNVGTKESSGNVLKNPSFGILTTLVSTTLLLVFAMISQAQETSWNFEEIIVDNNPPSVPGNLTENEVGDINNDGKPDLYLSGRKIGNSSCNSSLYKNTGDMHNWIRYNPWPGPSMGAAWGDVDGDGDMDLVCAKDRGTYPMQWKENPLIPGDNPEQAPWKVYTIDNNPADPDESHTSYIDNNSQLTQGLDVNKDGNMDIVVAAFKISLWYVQGSGNPKGGPGAWTYHEVQTESSGNHGGCAVADIDADGDMDIAWGNDWYENQGNPTGIWAKHILAPDFTDETQVEIADIDADGRLDVILSGEETSHGVAWYKNPGGNSTGPWTKTYVGPGEGLHSLGVADFDGDGDFDIMTAEMHTRGTNKLVIFENNNNSWTEHLLSNSGTHKAKVADLDGDGDMDIYGKNFGGDKLPRIWINPNGPFTLPLDQWSRHIIDSDGNCDYTILADDLNGDGMKDIVAGTNWYRNPGSAGGTWTRSSLGNSVGNAMEIYDFDSDGDMDVLGEGFGWARNNGTGSFTTLTNINGIGGFIQGHVIANFQGDLEVAYNYKNGVDIRMLTVPSDPSGDTWTDRQIFHWGGGLVKCLDSGDIDRDGDMDIIFSGKNTPVLQWLRNNGSSWSAHTFADSPQPITHRCKLGDINGDSKLDVLVGNRYGNRLLWYEQGTDATAMWTRHDISLNLDSDPECPLSIDMADLDNDGDMDVVCGENDPGDSVRCDTYIFENDNGAGTSWTQHHINSGDEHHQGTQLVDIDSDGDLDIISVGWTHNKVFLYENKALNGVPVQQVTAPALSP